MKGKRQSTYSSGRSDEEEIINLTEWGRSGECLEIFLLKEISLSLLKDGALDYCINMMENSK